MNKYLLIKISDSDSLIKKIIIIILKLTKIRGYAPPMEAAAK